MVRVLGGGGVRESVCFAHLNVDNYGWSASVVWFVDVLAATAHLYTTDHFALMYNWHFSSDI